MASRSQILTENNNSFPNNNSGQITPAILRDYNADVANSVVFLDEVSSLSVANATSASYAQTASYALNAGTTIDTGSFVTTSSFNVFSSSVDSQLTALENFSSSLDATFATDAQLNAATASLSASLAVSIDTKLDTTTFNVFTSSIQAEVNALEAATSSYVTNAQTSSMSVLSASFATTASFALNVPATASFAVSASYATTASYANFASTSTSASYASQAQNAVSSSFATNAASSATATSASYATTAGFAQTIASGLNITASNILVTNDLVVNGTASFGYTKTVTGSAVVIGDEFIILNADTPTAPYAGIKVYDTGSATTASLEWNGLGDYWIQVDEAGQSAAMLTGASGSKGSEVFPTSNRLIKGTGNNTVVDSNISDSGTLVSINSNTEITGSLGVTGVITGNLTGTASFALNGGVTQILAGPNITVSPLSGKGQVTVSSTGGGTGSFNTATGSYGSFYDTTTQTNPVANVVRSMSFNETSITNGVSISGSTDPFNTYIKTENAGIYNLQFSAQVDKTDLGTDEVYMWISKNGIDLLDTAGKVTLDGGNAAEIVSWNYYVQSAANDYYQLNWSSPDTGMRLLAEVSSSTHPGIPSVIVTANRIDQFLSNTGSFSGSFTGDLTGTASYATYAANAGNAATATSASYSLNASQATSASFATTASYAENAASASYAPSTPAFPFTGSAQITGSLGVTGSYFSKPQYITTERSFPILEGQDDFSVGGNIILTRTQLAISTGSVAITGSNNFIALSNGAGNTLVNNGGASIIRGINSIILGNSVPTITGSNGSGYNRTGPLFSNSISLGSLSLTDNRTSTSPTFYTNTNTIVNGTVTATISTGSLGINNSNINASLALTVTGSNGTAKAILNSTIGGGARIDFVSSGSMSVQNSVIAGNALTASLVDGASSMLGVVMLGNGLSVSGSLGTAATGGSTYAGRFNALDSTALSANTVFAVGAGTSNAARKTSLHVSASGLTTVRDGLEVSGSLNISGSYSGSNVVGNWTDTFTQPKVNQIVTITEAEYNTVSGSTEALNTLYIITDSTSSFATSASYAVTASYAENAGASFPYTGNAQINGNLGVTGSTRGNIVTVTAVSNTASIDLNSGSAFTFTTAASNLINITNYPTGSNQKFSLLIATGAASSSVTFGSSFLFPSGSQYTPTLASGSVDILTFETYTY
jgi:hypothetical protein